MPRPTAVILIVALNEQTLAHMPRLKAIAGRGMVQRLRPCLPAVTCSVQSSMLTGRTPGEHGIVGNGWYNRELAEVQFWKQSNRLVQGEKVWETARREDRSIRTANVCWWYNMYSSVDYSVTPRPIYKADGRKIPDCYSEPPALRDRLQAELGTFPLFQFWGPGASIASSRWIAEAAKRVHTWHAPALNLVYLPHLDYALQKYGPRSPEAARAAGEIDDVAADLAGYFESAGVTCVFVSEYGIEPASLPVHVNRALREAGLLRVRVEQGLELLDVGASRAFAVADHQVAHVHVRDEADRSRVNDLCRRLPGVAQVLDADAQQAAGIAHERSGEFVLVAERGAWFTYYYWLDDASAPDFARTVDIHRKPGYDPAELFLDPTLTAPKLQVAWRLLKRKLGQRTLLDVIPLDATLVRGTHGRVEQPVEEQPLLILPTASESTVTRRSESIPAAAIRDVILGLLL